MMNKVKKTKARELRRKNKVRAKISGTASRPRLSVFRSNRGLYLQIIDDASAKTLASAHTKEVKDKKLNKTDLAKALGLIIADKALAQGIKEIVFDRSSYRYHGRVKAVADSAREKGLVF
jgi:large subunit ribosomal protein L18